MSLSTGFCCQLCTSVQCGFGCRKSSCVYRVLLSALFVSAVWLWPRTHSGGNLPSSAPALRSHSLLTLRVRALVFLRTAFRDILSNISGESCLSLYIVRSRDVLRSLRPHPHLTSLATRIISCSPNRRLAPSNISRREIDHYKTSNRHQPRLSNRVACSIVVSKDPLTFANIKEAITGQRSNPLCLNTEFRITTSTIPIYGWQFYSNDFMAKR